MSSRCPIEDLKATANQPAKHEAELWEDCARENRLKEADAAPAKTDGSRDGDGGSKDLPRQTVDEADRCLEQTLDTQHRQCPVIDSEEAGEFREGQKVLADVGNEARCLRGVDQGTGEVSLCRMCAGGDGIDDRVNAWRKSSWF